VLEAVLDGLRGGLAAGRLDGGLERLERLRLALDELVDGLVGVGREGELGDLGRRLAAERGDLLDQARGVLELGQRVLAHLLGVRLVLEPDHAARDERVVQHRAVLEAQRRVEALDLLLDIHRLFGHWPLLPLGSATPN
jgi:hypothetical protein